MFNRFRKYLVENKIFKQLCFQVGHSTGHAIIQLLDQIFDAFEKNLSIYLFIYLIIYLKLTHLQKYSIHIMHKIAMQIG